MDAVLDSGKIRCLRGDATGCCTIPKYLSGRASSNKLYYASSGIAANTHLSAELFNSMVGTKMHHIPYQRPRGFVVSGADHRE
jgi:hypothetical protein